MRRRPEVSYDAALRDSLSDVLTRLRARPARAWAVGAGWCLALAALYLLAWRPVRVWLAHDVVGPLLASVADGSAVRAAAHAVLPYVRIEGASVPDGSLKLWIDGGRIVLVPMAVLALLFPYGRYLLYPWLWHLVLIVAEVLAGLVGTAGVPGGFSAYVFLHGYVMVPTTVAFPLLVLLFADPAHLRATMQRSPVSGGAGGPT